MRAGGEGSRFPGPLCFRTTRFRSAPTRFLISDLASIVLSFRYYPPVTTSNTAEAAAEAAEAAADPTCRTRWRNWKSDTQLSIILSPRECGGEPRSISKTPFGSSATASCNPLTFRLKMNFGFLALAKTKEAFVG